MLDASVHTGAGVDVAAKGGIRFNLSIYYSRSMVSTVLCDRIAVMNAGRIVELGATHEILPTLSTLHPNPTKAAPLLTRN
jgi:ABC-type oligopeptide transport system ATPase subunit